jgi:hypothetical protein
MLAIEMLFRRIFLWGKDKKKILHLKLMERIL